MKRKHNGGYSLIEVLIAMAVLGIITIPTTSALLTAHRMNVKAEQMLEAQLDVSSAVETLMAEGVSQELTDYTNDTQYPGVKITTKKYTETMDNGTVITHPYYEVTVTSNMEKMDSVFVETYIRAVG